MRLNDRNESFDSGLNAGVFSCVSIPPEKLDDNFIGTLTTDERFRYELLILMKKEGYKLINSKYFKKREVYIPVTYLEEYYKENKTINIRKILDEIEDMY